MTDRSAFFDVSFEELRESYRWRESITARLTLTIRSRGTRCEEKSRGIHTALSHSANAENVCE